MFGNRLDSSLLKISKATNLKRCWMCGFAIRRVFHRAGPSLLLLLWALLLVPSQGLSQADTEDTGPLLLSISPLTARPGNLIKLEVRGNRLDGVYALWSDDSGIRGQVLNVEEVKDLIKPRVRPSQQEIKPIPVFRVLIDLQINTSTRVGVHSLQLISHGGVSNAFSFPVVDAPVTVEASSSHQTIEQAQPANFPGFISGKLGEPGEVDFYSIQVRKGQELRFEVVEGQKFDASAEAGKFSAELALYQAGGSWFDARRPTRVLFEEERSSDLMPANPGGTYRFSEDGQYFLQISGLFGQGCADCAYQVRVFPSATWAELTSRTQPATSEWWERSLARHLKEGWTKELEARSVKGLEAPAKELSSGQGSLVPVAVSPEPPQVSRSSHAVAFIEHEPNDQASQSESISIPTVIEGTIARPGDLDSFKFKVEA